MAKKGRPYLRKNGQKQPVAAQPHKIRAWREWNEWTQEMLAEKTQTKADPDGVSVSAISAYERGEDNPSLEALQKLANAFGIPRGMLLDVDPNDDPPLWASVLKSISRRT